MAIPAYGPVVGAVILFVAWAFDDHVPMVAFAAVLVFVSTIVQVQVNAPFKSTLPPLM